MNRVERVKVTVLIHQPFARLACSCPVIESVEFANDETVQREGGEFDGTAEIVARPEAIKPGHRVCRILCRLECSHSGLEVWCYDSHLPGLGGLDPAQTDGCAQNDAGQPMPPDV